MRALPLPAIRGSTPNQSVRLAPERYGPLDPRGWPIPKGYITYSGLPYKHHPDQLDAKTAPFAVTNFYPVKLPKAEDCTGWGNKVETAMRAWNRQYAPASANPIAIGDLVLPWRLDEDSPFFQKHKVPAFFKKGNVAFATKACSFCQAIELARLSLHPGLPSIPCLVAKMTHRSDGQNCLMCNFVGEPCDCEGTAHPPETPLGPKRQTRHNDISHDEYVLKKMLGSRAIISKELTEWLSLLPTVGDPEARRVEIGHVSRSVWSGSLRARKYLTLYLAWCSSIPWSRAPWPRSKNAWLTLLLLRKYESPLPILIPALA